MSTNPASGAPISQAFDREATGYSLGWESRRIVRVFRARVVASVVRSSPPPARVLDLGCGIGTDAHLLEALGYEVVGIDTSPSMVELARAGGVKAYVRRVEGLGAEARDAEGAPSGGYDVVLSNFGALNCVAVRDAVDAVRLSLVAGGVFVCVTISKHCPAEWLALAKRGQWPFRRRAVVPVKTVPVPMHYASPREWSAALGPDFRCERVEALGLLAAPPDLGGEPGFATRVEPFVAQVPGLRALGDHTLMVFRRLR